MEPSVEVAQEAAGVLEGDAAGEVLARVGQTVVLHTGRAGAHVLRGAPPGMFVRADGVIDYDLGPGDAGRWDITVVNRAGPRVSPLHFVLDVTGPVGATTVELVPGEVSEEVPEEVPEELPVEVVTVGRSRSGLTVGCGLSVGAALGIQEAPPGASPWETLGPWTDRRTASPAALGSCTTNTPLAPVFGLEVTPFARIRDEAAPITWWGGVQVVVRDVSVGPYATRSNWGYGVGARGQWQLGRWGGPEVRLNWVPPGKAGAQYYRNEDALSAGLAWTFAGWL